ncbi:hypothetical protein [Ramlibacter sp.]|uniref:hypothetical protein n=1 Tax=Ramlibacter sp. TaxID=1917967 RepID=UPI0018255B7B|nr:hypothetical protein [Ramlibacter sp.]MBA2675629.1 hypothetical protein [Ramlibacter sp.]
MGFVREAAHCTPYEQCLQETASQSGKFLQRVVRRAVHQMRQQAGSDAEEAALALMHTQDRLCTLYQRALIRSVQAHEQAHPPACDAHAGSLEVTQLGAIAARTAQAELARLDTLIGAAGGGAGVNAGSNPLRPSVHAHCLHEALKGMPPLTPGVRAQWIAHLGMALGDELVPLYDVLARKLRGRAVREQAQAPLPLPAMLVRWAQSAA